MKGKDTPSNEALKERILAAFVDLAEQDPQEVMREALKAEGSPAADSEADGGPTDDELFAVFQQHLKGEGQAPSQPRHDEGTEPTDDELFAAFRRAWQGEDS
jgi:hypothetical protein